MNEERLVNILRKRKETISTMESCIAGYLATTITNVYILLPKNMKI